jgi:hypothetical protein
LIDSFACYRVHTTPIPSRVKHTGRKDNPTANRSRSASTFVERPRRRAGSAGVAGPSAEALPTSSGSA